MKKSSTSTSTISEVDKYLGESIERFVSHVPVINTWLRIPFISTSGRVLDTFRSSLSDKSIESLICTQDWLRKDKDRILEKEEDCEAIIIDSSEDEGSRSKRDVNGRIKSIY
ncbi:hypothetical protein Tco_1000331 [Tanacetum coccineum]